MLVTLPSEALEHFFVAVIYVYTLALSKKWLLETALLNGVIMFAEHVSAVIITASKALKKETANSKKLRGPVKSLGKSHEYFVGFLE